MHIKVVNKKRFALLILIASAIIAGLVFGGAKIFKKKTENKELEEKIYEALIQTKGKDKYEKEEDRKTFFENGDAMAIFLEGHPWTRTEKEELIVKMRIKEEDANKLLEGETKELRDRNRDLREGEGGDNEANNETETVLLRKRMVDLGQIDRGKPDKVYGREVIREK